MSEGEKQEGQKTVVAFVAGLLIGALLVWVFTSPSDSKHRDHHDKDEAGEVEEGEAASSTEAVAEGEAAPAAPMKTGEGALAVADQAAGSVVSLGDITFPNDEGWVAVRTYENDQLGNILGASRFSKEQGLVPSEVELLAPTVSGGTYAAVFFTENGDRVFDLATDMQVEGVWETFTAN